MFSLHQQLTRNVTIKSSYKNTTKNNSLRLVTLKVKTEIFNNCTIKSKAVRFLRFLQTAMFVYNVPIYYVQCNVSLVNVSTSKPNKVIEA